MNIQHEITLKGKMGKKRQEQGDFNLPKMQQ